MRIWSFVGYNDAVRTTGQHIAMVAKATIGAIFWNPIRGSTGTTDPNGTQQPHPQKEPCYVLARCAAFLPAFKEALWLRLRDVHDIEGKQALMA